MARETSTYDERLRDLEAEAFRTGRTPAEHGEQLQMIGEQQTTAFGFPVKSVCSDLMQQTEALTHRPDTISERLETIERVLIALARARGVDPDELVGPRGGR